MTTRRKLLYNAPGMGCRAGDRRGKQAKMYKTKCGPIASTTRRRHRQLGRTAALLASAAVGRRRVPVGAAGRPWLLLLLSAVKARPGRRARQVAALVIPGGFKERESRGAMSKKAIRTSRDAPSCAEQLWERRLAAVPLSPQRPPSPPYPHSPLPTHNPHCTALRRSQQRVGDHVLLLVLAPGVLGPPPFDGGVNSACVACRGC